MANAPRNGPEEARAFLDSLVSGAALGDGRPTFDATALQGLRVVEVAEGRVVAELPVTQRVQNRYGTLHGGAAATLVDTVSSAALLTTSPYVGVSVTLAVNYVAPMPGSRQQQQQELHLRQGTASSAAGGKSPGHVAERGNARGDNQGEAAASSSASGQGEQEGEVVVIDARVTRVGKQLATLAVELRRKATGRIVATGTHTKFLQVPDQVMDKLRERVRAKEAGPGAAQPRSRL